MRHLVRKAEYARLGGEDWRFIKGQKYDLLSRHHPGRQALARDFARRQLASEHRKVRKETFGQLRDYGCEAGRSEAPERLRLASYFALTGLPWPLVSARSDIAAPEQVIEAAQAVPSIAISLEQDVMLAGAVGFTVLSGEQVDESLARFGLVAGGEGDLEW
jgi:hypothetical protein